MRLSLLFLIFSFSSFSWSFTTNIDTIERPFTPQEVVAFTRSIASLPHVTVSTVEQSYDGRDIPLVKLAHDDNAKFKVFYHAQQHGNETSGKDALMFLMQEYANNPEMLPQDVAVYILPVVNPDGAHENERVNHRHADLNRDHILLKQKETQLLHRLIREIQPHVVVDGHEFKRDTADFVEQGWKEWPLVMVDVASHPLYHPDLYQLGENWLDRLDKHLNAKGFNHDRYAIVYNPPYGEYRFSTMDADDARNSAGVFYGALSFIVEAGVFRTLHDDPYHDLSERVKAYVEIYKSFIHNQDQHQKIITTVNKARTRSAPKFLATNYFWGSEPNSSKHMKVINIKTNEEQIVEVPNYMPKRIVKKRVPAPAAYAIHAKHASTYVELLNKHGIPYEEVDQAQNVTLQTCTLLRVEEEYDELYERYGGRQIVQCENEKKTRINKGSLLVKIAGSHAYQAAIILEPLNLYGLYQYEEYRDTLMANKQIPVYRVNQL